MTSTKCHWAGTISPRGQVLWWAASRPSPSRVRSGPLPASSTGAGCTRLSACFVHVSHV